MGSRARLGGRSHSKRDRCPEIEAPQVGVAIPLAARLRALGARWGDFIVTFDRVTSTNDVALHLAKKGAPHGSIVLAREQTGGRGRFERRWQSSPGGLYLSAILRPNVDDPVALIPHLTAVAAAESIIAATGIEVRLRWPNDLFANDGKVGGILCEGSFHGALPEAIVAGIGINVNQRVVDLASTVRHRATSLAAFALDVDELAAHIVAGLERWWRRRAPGPLVARFRELAEGVTGQRVRVQPRAGEAFTAVTHGISDDGGLIVTFGDGSRRILYSEDVYLLANADDDAENRK